MLREGCGLFCCLSNENTKGDMRDVLNQLINNQDFVQRESINSQTHTGGGQANANGETV